MSESENKLQELPVSVMAYIGDAVYELTVRMELASRFRGKSGELHRRCVRLVKASAQAEAARSLLTDLTPEEESIFRRGRNSAPCSMPRHAAPADYRLATGLEALIGWLHLTDKQDRIDELMRRIMEEFAYGEERRQSGQA
ncbi:MAG: mini-ribonuclease [Clostridiales bacterium]|jgi:ribonuclease-3 family protein|nr:ribonuclease III domain-containing protein [Eubacteriales bacterium]MDD3196717.1 ribonuclease III domain-containing protein [Eubacteriales bacterium]MDD3503557.1 ribonuclease III domain-containing protein [Eubacteriales bacterium]MDD4681973.1 ribonuclease III domain-containing protein [Eubacteriales bacterium]MDN5314485.1 mini-ribonuclease [Clostridiales bacterium]